jgi:hypothetical protein
MTRKQMADQIKAWLGLQDIAVMDEAAMIDQQLWLGTIDLLARTKCVARCVELQMLVGVSEYRLNHQVLALVDIENGARPRARRDQSGLSPSFALIRSDILRVTPTPSATGELAVWGVLRPQMMAADTDSPGDENFGAIPDEFQDAILAYAMWKLADYADDGSSGQGERYRVMYEGQDGNGGRIREIRSQVNKRGTAKGLMRKVRLQAPLARGSWVG